MLANKKEEKKTVGYVNKVSVSKVKKEENKSNSNHKIDMVYDMLDAHRLDLNSMQEELEKMSSIVKRLRIRAGI
jgi:hypothetical protein